MHGGAGGARGAPALLRQEDLGGSSLTHMLYGVLPVRR